MADLGDLSRIMKAAEERYLEPRTDVTQISTTGGTTVLTDDQQDVAAIKVSGTLVSNSTIEFDGRGGSWVVVNATDGNFTVMATMMGQMGGIPIAQGGAAHIWCEGGDMREGRPPLIFDPSPNPQVVSATKDAYFLLDAWLPYPALNEDEEALRLLYQNVWIAKRFNCPAAQIWEGLPEPDWLIGRALSGSRSAQAALCYIAEELPSGDWPRWLQEYVVDALRYGPSPARRGRRRANSRRDQVITWVTLVVAERYGLKPVRNNAAARDPEGVDAQKASACSIVDAALRANNVHMSEENVNRIWSEGKGRVLLNEERATWIHTAPIGRALDYPALGYLIEKLSTQLAWGTLFSGVKRAP
jgi:hypothetical protein